MLGLDGPLDKAVSLLSHCYGYRVNVSILPWPKERLCNIINPPLPVLFSRAPWITGAHTLT